MIDTHLHLWELARGWYDWNTPELGAVHADSSLDAVRTDLADAGVSAAILVQAADTLEETDWLLAVAEREPAVAGVVGYLPLDDRQHLESQLATYASRPLLGVRQLWHDHDRLDELVDPETLTCLGILGDAGLPVDVPDAFLGVWPALSTAAGSLPGTRFVLDHCGKPPFGDAARWAVWEAAFAELASRPNVIVKLSGLFGESSSGHAPTEHELVRVVELIHSTAGADRTMIGSDWPMARGLISYPETFTRLGGLLAGWDPGDQEAALHETARRVYGVG